MKKENGFLISAWNSVKKFMDLTTLKFLAVGVVNTLVGTGLMFVLYNIFSVNYWISSASNYIVGSIVSYFLNKYFTFQNKERSAKQVICFIVNITLSDRIWSGKTGCFCSTLRNERKSAGKLFDAGWHVFVCSTELSGTAFFCI